MPRKRMLIWPGAIWSFHKEKHILKVLLQFSFFLFWSYFSLLNNSLYKQFFKFQIKKKTIHRLSNRRHYSETVLIGRNCFASKMNRVEGFYLDFFLKFYKCTNVL